MIQNIRRALRKAKRTASYSLQIPYIFPEVILTSNNPYYIVCLALLLSFSPHTNAQSGHGTAQRKRLTANDFTGMPDPKSDHLATTFTLLSYQYYNPHSCMEKGRQKFTFQTSMRMGEKSWIRFDKIRSRQLLQELLDHEQGHYDIAEVFSVQLQKNLSGSCFDHENYKTEIDSVYQSTNKYYSTLQYRYDLETNYGQNKDMQIKWKSRIDDMIKGMMSP